MRFNANLWKIAPGFDILRANFAEFKEAIMNGFLKTVVLGVACFALGAVATRYYDNHRLAMSPPASAGDSVAADNLARVDLEHEPLWAYGFDKVAAPGEVAKPQAPPNRNL